MDRLKVYPDSWKVTETPVLWKPGKADYTVPGAWQPIVLSNGYAWLLNGCKTEDLVVMCEKLGILPANHFGGWLGHGTTDSVHLLVKTIKDVWQRNRMALVLFLDIKGAFPRTAIDWLLHNMHVQGVPIEHVEWMTRQLEGRRTRLIFDDYRSDMFHIDNSLDQGNPHSLICYLIYNSDLLSILDGKNSEMGLLFIDDAAVVAVGDSFDDTHWKLQEMMTKAGGIFEWAQQHNCEFGIDKFQLLNASQKMVQHPFMPCCRVPIPCKALVIGNNHIEPKSSIKFLGIHVDQGLWWKEQCASAIAKGQDWLIQFSRLARASGGVLTWYVRQLYLAIAVPQMLYVVDIFLTPYKCAKSADTHKSEQAIINKLAAIQQ
jgi:hypothetical protein